MEYLAHSANRAGRVESNREHLSFVADRAALFARSLNAESEGRAAGLLHDLGKFGDRFQQRIERPHIVQGVDHWSFGAEAAWLQYGAKTPSLAVALSCAIRGHHIGLQQAPADPKACRDGASAKLVTLASELGETDYRAIVTRFAECGLVLPAPWRRSIYLDEDPASVAAMLDVRMLFSALVDADYIETEAHFSGTRDKPRVYRDPAPSLEPGRAMARLLDHIEQVKREDDSATAVVDLREALRADCLAAAAGRRGIYTLTAPTGTGKTLAMLAFALHHASTHSAGEFSIRRIVLTIPFLTIIEQTANIYRGVFRQPEFGASYVIEDHSQAGTEVRGTDEGGDRRRVEPLTINDDGTRESNRERRRLLAENWDAPIVITTSVQMLESLFANRPRPCRKLHRLANSILLFDEVQTLPAKLAVATLAAVSRLVERYGCTAVFATATQPAFEHLQSDVRNHCARGWLPEEVVRPGTLERMFHVSADRAHVEWRLDGSISWESLAQELAGHKQLLCVVNLKRHAKQLVELLQSLTEAAGFFHLSTNLCPAHRNAVLAEVRRRLKKGHRQCRLIATQCIEAGVDVDFPIAYRALGPLEAIAQVAGRCNRGGKRPRCRVIVFVPQKGRDEAALYPPGYGEAAEHARIFVHDFIRRNGAEAAAKLIHDPDAIAACFRQLYDISGGTRMPSDLADALVARDFERVAAEYRLIASDTVRVLVPYDETSYSELRQQADGGLPFKDARGWFARAAPLSVSIFRPPRHADVSGLIPVNVGSDRRTEGDCDWYVLADEKLYDCNSLGLLGIGDCWVV
jgi:CRISPR-associated endonuclease Cas3-HD